MKPINITGRTAEVKVICALELVQSRCTVRTIESQDIRDALANIEKHLGVPKCHLNGTHVVVDINGQDFPGAYKFTPESTIFEAVNVKGKWHIVDIRRGPCHRFNDRVRCTLSDETKTALLDRFSRFSI